jgi:transposase
VPDVYDSYQRRVAECDQQLQKHLTTFTDTVPPPAKEELPPKKKGNQNKNNPHFHLADELQRITVVDLTRIDGVDVMVAQTLVSEVGLDMSRWKTEAHFASWLGLCPDNRISGDKVLARGTRHVVNPSQVLCLRESCMRANRTCSLGGGRRPARKRASSDPTDPVPKLGVCLCRVIYSSQCDEMRPANSQGNPFL